ncbi:hypothetical protein GQ600_7176 [Phytophthora cactorum]|nr:hypothetical protein GQ600_7176 [Phytophthora cactorum]
MLTVLRPPDQRIQGGYQTQAQPIESCYGIEDDAKAPLYSPHEVNRSTSSSCEDEEKRETCDEKDKGEESSDGELSTHLQFLEEKLPRERHSKTKPARETMIVAHVNVDNYVGQVPRKGYASWNSWEAAYEEYCSAEDDCDAMVIHDQMVVACGMLVQTATQKLVFKQRGETLAMDWTHGTNNVGYHLGNVSFCISNTFLFFCLHNHLCFIVFNDAGRLVATTPTGRGYPVLDFMLLNEKAVTLEKIFEFFKNTNTSWMKIRTFVIDKHFVEWRVLEKCFPSANVLLASSMQLCIGRNGWELGSAWWLRTKTQFNATLQRCCIGITDVIELQQRYWRNSDYTMAKSVFEPILNHLKRLSSADFYKALEKWEGVVDQSVKPAGTATNTSDKDTCIEEENYDVDLTGYYDTVRMMEEMEAMQDSGDEEEEEGCSPTQPAATTSSQTLLNPITSSVPATLSASATLTSNGSAHTMHEHINEAAVTAADMSLSVFAPSTEKSNASEPERENKPTPCQTEYIRSESVFESTAGKNKRGVALVKGKHERKLRQKWSAVAAKPRYILVEYPKGLTAKVTDVVKWAQHTTRANDVTDILEKYPCIMNEQTIRGRVRRVKEVTQQSAPSYCYSYVIPEDLISCTG